MSSQRSSLVAALAVAVVVSSATLASAQQRGRGGFGNFMRVPGIDRLMLLNQEPVRKELKLSADQETSVRELAEEARSELMEFMSGVRELSPEERTEKAAELRAELAKSVEGLLTKVDGVLQAPQKERLKQLSVQQRGAFGSLQDPEVQTALKLSDEQKKKVETLVEESRPARGQGAGGGGGGGGDREAARERFQAMQKERNEKALGILSAEQRAELEKMQGPKFDFPPMGRGGGFFPGA